MASKVTWYPVKVLLRALVAIEDTDRRDATIHIVCPLLGLLSSEDSSRLVDRGVDVANDLLMACCKRVAPCAETVQSSGLFEEPR